MQPEAERLSEVVRHCPQSYEEGYQVGLHGIEAGPICSFDDAQVAWYIGHCTGYWEYLARKRLS